MLWLILAIVIYLVIGIAYVIRSQIRIKQGKYKGRTVRIPKWQFIVFAIFIVLTWVGAAPYAYLYDKKHKEEN